MADFALQETTKLISRKISVIEKILKFPHCTFFSEMSKLTDGVTLVHLYSHPIDKSKTRGYAFVEYESHRAAALARRKLVPGNSHLRFIL